MDKEPFTLVIFGITSNLTAKYLIPALYDLTEKKLLPSNTSIIGVARSEQEENWIQDHFHSVLHSENRHHQHQIKETVKQVLFKQLHYLDGNLQDPEFYLKLKEKLERLGSKNIIFYLAIYPNLYKSVLENLKQSKLTKNFPGFTRIMVEKPIGTDQKSSKKLNKLLSEFFKEDQIYRLDHYLGKETIQNILTFRSSNPIFESLMNNKFIDHIQITSSEDFGIKDRGGYYDSVGALKDVGQNHILQMLAFALMDLPKKFTNQAITDSRFNLIKSLQPFPKKIVFGQYQGYTNEKNVDSKSKTDTFFALKTFIKSSRFKNVPIYIRAGKNLSTWVTEISIVFKTLASPKSPDVGGPNTLIYRIQPNEGIILNVNTKKPGSKTELESSYMQFCYHHLNSDLPDAYEKLLMNVTQGDQTFFNDAKEVEVQWKFIDPLFQTKKKPFIYPKASWGPKEADDLIKKDGRSWLEPSNLFCNL